MILYPAIDLLGGRVVRLEQGRPETAVAYSEDPLDVVRHFADQGAAWIHIVDLDRALGEGANNREPIRRIVEAAGARGVRVQVGGGLRQLADALDAVATGAERIVVGTAAALEPADVVPLVADHGPRLVVALDARDGEVVVRGWTEGSGRTVLELGIELSGLGVRRFLYTDVGRDGMGSGPDLEGAVALARATGGDVLASGGVAGIADVTRAKAAGVGGLVVGRALYEGRLDLAAAIALAGPQA